MCKEELHRYTDRYIEFVKSLDGRMLQLNREMRKAFGVHYQHHFACCPDIPVQEFCNYLADFPRLREAEVASCKVEVQVGAWFRRWLSLKGRVKVCAVYIFPLILYWLSILPLPRDHWAALERSLSKLLWFVGRSAINVLEKGIWGCLTLRATGSPGLIVNDEDGVESQGERGLSLPEIQSQG